LEGILHLIDLVFCLYWVCSPHKTLRSYL